MSPRPVDLPEPEFDAQLRQARGGDCRGAWQAIRREMHDLERRESRAPAAVAALAEIARLAQAGGDPLTAEHALDLALELRPRYADLHFQRACLWLTRQRRDDARRSLEAAIRLNPRYLAARLERALLDARDGRVGEALVALRSLARDVPAEETGAFQAGIRRLEQAEWEEAESLLKRAIERSGPDLREPLERVRAALERGEAGAAIRVLREVLPHHEHYPDLHYLLGMAEFKLGHFDDALAALARSLELNPDFNDARVHFARTLESLGMSADATRQVTLVLSRDPHHAQALELRASWAKSGAEPRRPRAGVARGARRRAAE